MRSAGVAPPDDISGEAVLFWSLPVYQLMRARDGWSGFAEDVAFMVIHIAMWQDLDLQSYLQKLATRC